MLYSVGKDSAVMLHIAKRHFFLCSLSIDACGYHWKFQAMYKLRDKAAKDSGMDLIVHQNPEAKESGLTCLIMAHFTRICGKPRG